MLYSFPWKLRWFSNCIFSAKKLLLVEKKLLDKWEHVALHALQSRSGVFIQLVAFFIILLALDWISIQTFSLNIIKFTSWAVNTERRNSVNKITFPATIGKEKEKGKVVSPTRISAFPLHRPLFCLSRHHLWGKEDK